MTGRDLIVYILQNNLEDENVFKDGRLLGFLNEEEFAVKTDVGVSTVEHWCIMEFIPSIKIGSMRYIPANITRTTFARK